MFQRKDGRYVAQIRLENGKKKLTLLQDGKRSKRSTYEICCMKKNKGRYPTGPNQTLKVYLEEWLEQAYKLSVIRTGTYYMYSIYHPQAYCSSARTHPVAKADTPTDTDVLREKA